MGIEVVDDFDFGVGVDVGGEGWGEDTGEEFVDSLDEGSSVDVFEEDLGLTGGSLSVIHLEFWKCDCCEDAECK